MVLFPLENGRFKLNHVLVGGTYEVHRNCPPDAPMPLAAHVQSPYGAYTNPTFSNPSPPLPHPPRSSKLTNKIKKTIVMVSLSKKGKEKAKARLDYTPVTQVVVSLTPAQCSVPAVTQLVTQQVEFEVLLLDSKCYPVLTNDQTRPLDQNSGKVRKKYLDHQNQFMKESVVYLLMWTLNRQLILLILLMKPDHLEKGSVLTVLSFVSLILIERECS